MWLLGEPYGTLILTSARWSAAAITANAQNRITPRIQTNRMIPIGTLFRFDFDSSESPKRKKRTTVTQPAISDSHGSSRKSQATKSASNGGPSGSWGRGTKAVWRPCALAAIRSPLCAATIVTSRGFNPSAAALRR